jgi:hypothetical protein
MNNVSSVVESQIQSLSKQLLSMMSAASNIAKNYTATNAETLIQGLATSSTPATVSTALDQYQFESGITFCTQIAAFFGNSSVSSADYLGICQNLLSGSTPALSALSPGVENLGNQLYQLAQNVIQYYQNAVIMNAAYNQNGLAQTVSAISSDQVVPGCNTTADSFTAGITMVAQFINLMTNQSVTTGNYLNTASAWTND